MPSCIDCLCVVLWTGSLSKGKAQDIERVQRNAYKIIFGASFTDYDQCLDDKEEETLAVRLDKLCINFAKSRLKYPKFSEWFQETKQTTWCLNQKPKDMVDPLYPILQDY